MRMRMRIKEGGYLNAESRITEMSDSLDRSESVAAAADADAAGLRDRHEPQQGRIYQRQFDQLGADSAALNSAHSQIT